MKNIFVLLSLLFISCAEKPMDVEQAKAVAESHIINADKQDFEAVEELYTAEFKSSEPMDRKKEKLIQLKNVMGELKSQEFLKFTHVAEFGLPKQVILEYRVIHTGVNSIEKFAIVEDEGGYRIASYSVESEN